MKLTEREIIFETMTGSFLYGTNRPDSDQDFQGVFLPSTIDMLGLQNCPTEWSMNEKKSEGDKNVAGDIDRKYFSVKKFLSLLGEGQSQQLEMLYSPRELWVTPTRPFKGAWASIYSKRDEFLSKRSCSPFIGFATAQAHKAVIKGENLKKIRRMIEHLEKQHPHAKLGDVPFLGGEVMTTTEGGIGAIVLAGRQYEFTSQVRYVLQKLRRIEKDYGQRSETAAENIYDFKSLMHAYRLIEEAKQILTEGKLILPFDPETVKFFLSIRNGEYVTDYFEEIQDKLTEVKELKEKSTLRDTPDHAMINELCQEILYNHLFTVGA